MPILFLVMSLALNSSGAPLPHWTTPSTIVRGVYGHDSTYDPAHPYTTGFALIGAAGFNAVQVEPSEDQLDDLAARGLKGVVWLGGFSKTTCEFEHDDGWIRDHVLPIAGHPAILAYYIADEPLVGACPAAPAKLRARTNLIHSLDATAKTFTVIQDWEPGTGVPYRFWAGSGAVDIFGFDVYPCTRSPYACDFSKIDQARGEIERLGFSPYWAILQDFGDCYYGLPSNDDLHRQFLAWQTSKAAGYWVFSWDYQGCAPSGYEVERVPGNVAELECENSLPLGPLAQKTRCSVKHQK